MEQNEYFINFDNAKIKGSWREGGSRARRSGGNSLTLHRVESSDPINSPWNEKSGFNKRIVWSNREDQRKRVRRCSRHDVNKLHP